MSETTYNVNEYFWSIQGEGRHMGYTAVFFRLQGCPVGCPWCDSKTTWMGGGTKMSLSDIVDAIDDLPYADLIIITGGEPLIWNLDALLATLQEAYFWADIHLETSGYVGFKGHWRPDWITLSPKAAKAWHVDDEVLMKASELKFVVDDDFSPDDVKALLAKRARLLHTSDLTGPPDIPVYLMPEGAPPRPEMVEKTLAVLEEHYGWHFSPRLQYAYPEIGKREGHNNQIITKGEALQLMRQRRRDQS